MADPLQKANEQFESTFKILTDLEREALGEFSCLQQIAGVVKEVPRISAIPSREQMAVWKSVQRKEKRLIQKAERVQRKVMAAQSDLNTAINAFRAQVPHSANTFFPTSLLSPLNGYCNLLVRFISRQDGILSEHIRERKLDAAETTISSLEKDAVQPLIAEIHRLRRYLEEHKLEILVSIGRAMIFSIDLGDFLQRRGIDKEDSFVIFDANVAKEVAIAKSREGKGIYDLHLSGWDLVLPRRVVWEMEHRRLGIGKRLVPQQLVVYFLRELGERIMAVRPQSHEEDLIVRLWRSTPKGQHASSGDEQQFRRSGDMHILTLALRERDRSVVIFSNDADVRRIVRSLGGRKLHVIGYEKGQLFRSV